MIESRSVRQGVSTDLSCLAASVAEGVRIAEGIARASCILGSYSPHATEALDSDQEIHHVPLRKVHSISVRRVLDPPYGTRIASPVVPVVHACSGSFRSIGSLGVSRFWSTIIHGAESYAGYKHNAVRQPQPLMAFVSEQCA